MFVPVVLLWCTFVVLTSCGEVNLGARMTLFPFPSELRDNAQMVAVTEQADEDDDDVVYFDECASNVRDKKNVKSWDHWGKWSMCSVTCGVGKMTRWRHCVSEGCSPGEKEAQIKTCTLSPCQ